MTRDQILSENVTFFSVIILPLLRTHFWSRSQNSEKRLLASSHSSLWHQKMRHIKYTYNIKMSLRHASVYYIHLQGSSVYSSALNKSAATERIVMKFDIWTFFENVAKKLKFYWNPTRIKGTLHKDPSTCMIVSRWIVSKMRNASNKICRENQYLHFMFSDFFPKIVPFVR